MSVRISTSTSDISQKRVDVHSVEPDQSGRLTGGLVPVCKGLSYQYNTVGSG